MAIQNNGADVEHALRVLFGWSKMSKPRQLGDRLVTWQCWTPTVFHKMDEDSGMIYHTEEEHARWVLEKEFGSSKSLSTTGSIAPSPALSVYPSNTTPAATKLSRR